MAQIIFRWGKKKHARRSDTVGGNLKIRKVSNVERTLTTKRILRPVHARLQHAAAPFHYYIPGFHHVVCYYCNYMKGIGTLNELFLSFQSDAEM